MHGRLKLRTTAEEAARKKKEQELKVKAYREGMKRIFEKRSKDELDNEMLLLTMQVLSKNPEVQTLWNIRKESILRIQENLEENDRQLLYDKDISFTEQCLMVNPKSYSAWHHRYWSLENCPKPNWEREVQICAKYLKLDERNFHCWDYRRYVAEKAGISPEQELEFCTEKIRNNFSNYSSWHYRSKLLPLLYPHETCLERPINEEKLKEELEMVLSAAFTDPNDSSAWFYQRWLLGYSEPELDIAAFRLTKDRTVLSFTKAVNLEDFQIDFVNFNINSDMDKWKPLMTDSNGIRYAKIWILDGPFEVPSADNEYKIICKTKLNKEFPLPLKLHASGLCGIKHPRFEYEFGTAVKNELKAQLDSCNQLLEFEPDSKWTLLTSALLMRAIDRKGYFEESLARLIKLQEVDDLRKGYYRDLASKWITEKLLEDWIESNSFPGRFNASKSNLYSIFYENYLILADEVDLSENFLRSAEKLSKLPFYQLKS